MTFKELKVYILSSLYRHEGRLSKRHFIRTFRKDPGFRYIVLLRLTQFFSSSTSRNKFLFNWLEWLLEHNGLKYGLFIDWKTEIGPGFFINHVNGITIHPEAKLGRDCIVSTGVVIGKSFRGKHQGTPTIGDRVYMAPGAMVFGLVTIGNDVVIGANVVVTKDVPDFAVLSSAPYVINSFNGSRDFIKFIDYNEEILKY